MHACMRIILYVCVCVCVWHRVQDYLQDYTIAARNLQIVLWLSMSHSNGISKSLSIM